MQKIIETNVNVKTIKTLKNNNTHLNIEFIRSVWECKTTYQNIRNRGLWLVICFLQMHRTVQFAKIVKNLPLGEIVAQTLYSKYLNSKHALQKRILRPRSETGAG